MHTTHLTVASVDRAVLYPRADALLAAVRTLARVGGEALVLFCVVDDHAHEVVLGDREQAGRMARRLAVGLGAHAVADLAPSRFKVVDGRAHLVSLVDYVLRQPKKHGLQGVGHPALWPGSCFVDLVGARLLDGFEPRTLARVLPRLTREQVYAAVELPPVSPLDDDEVRAEGPRRVGDAAAAAVGVTVLAGRSAPVVRARRAAARLCRALGFHEAQTAFGLRCPRATAGRMSREALPDPTLERAIRLQLAIRRVAR